MKRHRPLLVTFLVLTVGAFRAYAGAIFYVPIPATQSDVNSGISTDNGYTSAVDGGNTRGTDRVINGITLYALAGNGETSTADNCTLNALSGSLANGGGTTKSIQVDGTLKEIASDMTFNNGAGDNSQQEIVLDPESLEAGTTYDLRIYISNGSGQNRQVNLAFVGDGQEPVETGFFNEDDARTAAGGFKDQNQAYYINYRYTWDGDSTPGITVTQKSGGAPFCLYALTNQVVPTSGATAEADTGEEGEAAGGAAAGGEEAAEGGEEGLSAGYVNAESDEIGVSSDDFYTSESLNSNGRWINVDKWGSCWQPTGVQSGWCPYTNGSWKECDDCGWTFVSEEPWAWATYHYGRWCKVRTGCGWAWVPGKVWGASWVSWRQGRSGSSCDSCIGWAPLPPEAGCELGVGISSWVDYTCDIGPDCYTFVNIRDFGSDSYFGCGTCILDRGTYINIFEQTINITNICYDRHINIYSGGPDYNWCNTQIKKYGGKECEKVYVNRYDDAGKLGGKYAKKEGNQLGLVSPKIRDNKNAKHPKIAESVGRDKIDKGWGSAKANNKEKALKNHLAQETKGKTPKNTKGTLPPGVAEKQKMHHAGAGKAGKAGGAAAGAGQAGTQQLGGKGQHPGKKGLGKQAVGGQAGAGLDQHPGGKGKLKGQGQLGAAGAGQAAGAGFNQHPGRKGKLKGQGQLGATGAAQGVAGFDQHPGRKGKLKGQGQLGGAGAGQAGAAGFDQQAGGKRKGKGQGKLGGAGAGGAPGAATEQAAAGGFGKGGRHPGQSLKGQKKGQAGAGGVQGGPGQQATGQQLGGPDTRPGKKGKGKGAAGALGQQGQAQTLEGQGQGFAGQGGKGGKGKRKQQQLQQQQGSPQTSDQSTAGGIGTGGKGKRKQQQLQQQQAQGQPQTYGQAAGGGQGGGGKGKRKQQQLQQQQLQQPQGQPQTYGQAGGGGQGGGGKGKHKQQQQQAQQLQQGQQQQAKQLKQQQQQQAQQLQQQQQQKAQKLQQRQQQQQFQPQQQGGGGGGGGGKKKKGAAPTPTPY